MTVSFTVKLEPNSKDFYLQWRHIWWWHIKFTASLMLDKVRGHYGSYDYGR